MKSYYDFVNERAASGETIVTKHTDINDGETDQARFARTGLSSNDMTDAESAAVQKTPHRVSIESIRKKMVSCDYINPPSCPHMTLAVVMMDNGYIIIGKSVPADSANFNADLGRKFALEDAERQVWPLEAYLLREVLTIINEDRTTNG